MSNVRDLRAGKFDKRRKLSDEQKKEIIKLYNTGQWTIAQLAEEYGVSTATVGFLLKPPPSKQRPSTYKRYDRVKNTEAKRRYRQRLKELRDKSLIGRD